MPLNSIQIASILGAPVANVAANWPLVLAALEHEGIGSDLCHVAALATIGTEVHGFQPIKELSGHEGDAYFVRMYWTKAQVAHNLGNLSAEDAIAFCGRGFIQITGRANYARYGKALGLDLLNYPGMALEPETAARILALYFRVMKVNVAADAQDWQKVRQLVNGGLNGYGRFKGFVDHFLSLGVTA